MKISELLDKGSIVADLNSTDKKGVINELAAAVSPSANVSAEQIASVLLEREKLGSTGIGGGIAIPHGKLDEMDNIIVGFGSSPQGVEYDSLDNKPVHIFFVLLTPADSTGGHLKVLAQISKLLKATQFKDRLIEARTLDEIYDIVLEYDEDF